MWPSWFQITSWLLTAIIIIGNGLVIYLITTRRKLRTKTNWFVLSLAVADFGVGATYFPRVSVCWITDKTCVNYVIIIVYSIGYFVMSASVMNLCVLTLDRYLAIVKPMRYVTFMTTKRVALLISAAWGVSFVGVLIPRLTLYFATSPEENRNDINGYFFLFLDITTFFVCVFLLFATTRIFLIARRHTRQNAALIAQLNFNHRTQHGRVFKPQETAATKMVGVVVAVFLSYYFVLVFHHVSNKAEFYAQYKIRRMAIRLLLLLNSAVNPVAYALFKRDIRKELKRLFCC